MDGSALKKILLAWITLPLTALDWAVAWRRLPDQVVMKTGAGGMPIAWAPRAAAMRFDLLLQAGVLAFATVVGLLVAFAAPWKASAGASVVLLVGGFVFVVLNCVLWAYQVQ